MPSHTVKELLIRIEKLENKITELATDAIWIKRIIIGAAGLGFIEKLISWMWK